MVTRPTDIDEAITWRRADGWVHRILTGKVVLAAAGAEYRELSGGASVVWIVLDEPGTVGDIGDRVADALGSTVEDDQLRDAVQQMSDAGLIEHDVEHRPAEAGR